MFFKKKNIIDHLLIICLSKVKWKKYTSWTMDDQIMFQQFQPTKILMTGRPLFSISSCKVSLELIYESMDARRQQILKAGGTPKKRLGWRFSVENRHENCRNSVKVDCDLYVEMQQHLVSGR